MELNLYGLYETQRELNLYADLPHDRDQIELDILLAAAQEASEALQEMKSVWAWWSSKAIDGEALAEEHIDVLFFLLTFLDHLERKHGFDPKAFLATVEKSFEQLDEGLDAWGSNVYRAVRLNLRALMHAATSPEFDVQDLVYLLHNWYVVARLLGLTEESLDRLYRWKAVMNLNRWLAGNVVPAHLRDDAEALREKLREGAPA